MRLGTQRKHDLPSKEIPKIGVAVLMRRLGVQIDDAEHDMFGRTQTN